MSVHSLINSTFSDSSLTTGVFIQPPSKNTQLLSHIHMFKYKNISPKLNENYYDCEVILKIKREMLPKGSHPSTAYPNSPAVGVLGGGRPVTPEKKRSDGERATTPPRTENSSLTRQSTAARAVTPPREEGILSRQASMAH